MRLYLYAQCTCCGFGTEVQKLIKYNPFSFEHVGAHQREPADSPEKPTFPVCRGTGIFGSYKKLVFLML